MWAGVNSWNERQKGVFLLTYISYINIKENNGKIKEYHQEKFVDVPNSEASGLIYFFILK